MQSKETKGNIFLNKAKTQIIANKKKTITNTNKAIPFSPTLRVKPNSPNVGDICNLIVTALGPKNIGIDEFSYGYSILIPNAKLGEKVKVQIIKKNLNKAKYAVAKRIIPSSNKNHGVAIKSNGQAIHSSAILEDGKEKINVGDILTVKLNKIVIQTDNSSIGIVNSDLKLPIKYQLIIPNVAETTVGQEIQIQVTKMKLKYGFALIKSSVAKLDGVGSPKSLSSVYKTKLTTQRPTVQSLDKVGAPSLISSPQEATSISKGSNNIGGKDGVVGSSLSFDTNLAKPFISLSSRPSEAYVFGTSNSFTLAQQTGGNSVAKQGTFTKNGFPSVNGPKVNNYGKKNNVNNTSVSSFISVGAPSLADLNNTKNRNYKPFNVANMTKGSKITLTLPKTAKKYAKYLVINVLNQNLDKKLDLGIGQAYNQSTLNNGKASHNSYMLFLKNLLGAKLGDKVRVKFTKIGSSFAIGEIICISPNSSLTKLARVRKNLNEMLVNGMHYGEKVVKCQAKMRNFIWNRKKIINNSTTHPLDSNSYNRNATKTSNLGAVSYRGLVSTYPTFGKKNYSFNPIPSYSLLASNGAPKQAASSFNPKNGLSKKQDSKKQGINTLEGSKTLNKGVALIKKGRHLINLLKTRRCLNIGLNQLTKYAAKGRTFLFVGTKKPAAGLIARAALFSKTSFFVNTRWLGGMLTNWKTIIKSISKIRPILKEKQKVISNILQKRAKIQTRLLKKVFSLRKKSQLLIKKGKQLIAKLKVTGKKGSVVGVGGSVDIPTSNSNTNIGESFNSVRGPYPNESGGALKLNQINLKLKAGELFEKGQSLLEKRQNLLKKQKELKEKTLSIKENGFLIANKYKSLLTQLRITHTKFHDLRLLFLLNKELRQIKKLAKDQGKNKFILSYGKFQQLTTLATEKNTQSTSLENTDFINSKKFWLIPNPPQEILNKLLSKINSFASSNIQDSLGDKTKLNKQAKFTNKKTSFLNSMASSVSPLLGTTTLLNPKTSYPLIKNIKTKVLSSNQNHFSIKEKNTTAILKESKLIILTKLLSKFSRFLPYIKNCINLIKNLMQNIEKKIIELKNNLKYLKKTLTNYLFLNNKINSELELIKTKYLSEQQIIRILRRKLKRHEAEKKLLQFLPKLRYLPTPKSQISVAIQLLMKRFVDPKMKYPLDLIYDQASLKKKSKKVAAARKKKWQRLETYFGGIANMTKLKKTQIAKNVAIIIGQQEELNAIRECKKLGIKMFHIVDTNCNPGLADHFIPANDDSRNSIKYLLSKMVTRIRLAHKIRLRLKKNKK